MVRFFSQWVGSISSEARKLLSCWFWKSRPLPRFLTCPSPRLIRPATRSATLRSEEHTSELQSLMRISYAVFCLKKKNQNHDTPKTHVYRIVTHQTNQQ